jgi:hypothetical protein
MAEAPAARIDLAAAAKDAGLTAVLCFFLLLPLIGFRTVQNIHNEIALETRWSLLLTFVVMAATGRLFYSLVVAPWHHLFWIFLVPWLLALDGVATWRGALASGLAMALAFSVAVFSWFPLAMADYAGARAWIAVVLAVVAAPLFQPQLVVFPAARHAGVHGRGAVDCGGRRVRVRRRRVGVTAPRRLLGPGSQPRAPSGGG